MAGWFKLSRDIDDHWIFENPYYFHAWVNILMTVNYEDKSTLIHDEIIECKRGQSLLSIESWVRRLNTKKCNAYWTTQRVRTFFSLLEKQHSITIEGLRKTTRLTVCNYAHYQDDQRATNEQLTSNQRATNEQLTTTKEREERKERKEYKYKYLFLSEIVISDFPHLNNDHYQIALSFQKLFIENLNSAGASTKSVEGAKGTWIDVIRLMMETDGYARDDLREIYVFLQSNDFWKKNILSVEKLRKQMARLKMEAKNGTGNGEQKRRGEATSWNELAKIVSEAFNGR
jgi:hypothetical protein